MEAKFRISEQDYVDALKLHGKLTPKSLAVYLLLGLTLVLIAMIGSPIIRGGAIGGLAGAAVVVILGRFALQPILARRHYRKYKAMHDEFTIRLDDAGLGLESSNAKGVLPWGDILKWRENEDYLLIYLMPRLYHIVPKSVSQDGFDLTHFVKTLNENVGKPT
ncbi:MAG: YcxB family protein [Xanthomonadales bacterium]|nr:YcxB family protein [Xanthomonadales bacterium]